MPMLDAKRSWMQICSSSLVLVSKRSTIKFLAESSLQAFESSHHLLVNTFLQVIVVPVAMPQNSDPVKVTLLLSNSGLVNSFFRFWLSRPVSRHTETLSAAPQLPQRETTPRSTIKSWIRMPYPGKLSFTNGRMS
jgi:hypothetical protein